MLKLNVIAVSTREGRQGLPIARWFFEKAKAHGKLDPTLVDLKEVNLPLYDEPEHPRFKKYKHEHTKKWSAIVDAADAFVFVTPEYNYSPSPQLVNAFDHVYLEWNYKPVGFVSYGGVSGGLRGVQAARLQATTLKLVPVPEQVAVPMFSQHIKDGVFTSNEAIDKSVSPLLDELHKWATALKPMRG